MIQIPDKTNKAWTQTNTGEVLGELFGTRNMNFDKLGYAKLGWRSTPIVYNVSNFGSVTSIQTLDGNTFYVVATSGSFAVKLDGTAPTLVSGMPASIKADGVIWNYRWYVTADEVYTYDTIIFATDTGIGLTSGKYHPACVHEGLNQLAIGDGNTVKLYSYTNQTTHPLVTPVTLPSNYEVRWIRYNNNVLYIGTRNLSGGDAMVFTSDGVQNGATGEYQLFGANWVFSGCIWKGVLTVITSRGQLMKFNGSGFDELAHLPVYDTPYSWGNSSFVNGKVENRGMTAKGERIYIHLNGYVDGYPPGQLPNQPSGLWVYDESVGLYHRSSPTIDVSSVDVQITNVNTTNGVLTIGSSVVPPTGTKVFLRTSDVTGLSGDTFYYVIYISPTTFQLANSYANATNAVYIIPSTSGSEGCYITLHNDVTFGQSSNSVYHPGALAIVSDLNTSVAVYYGSSGSQIIYGAAGVYDTATNAINTLQSLTTGENRGGFITQKLFTNDILDTWQYIVSKYNNLFQGSDKIFFKYRNQDVSNYPLSVQATSTWASSNSFSVTADLSSVSIGDEVEICSGRGAGCCAHVTALVNSSGTWTVTLDDSIPGAVSGDKSYDLLFQNWIKLDTITSSSTPYYKNSINRPSKWVQFKVILKGVSEPFIEELQAINSKFIPSE